MIRYPGTIDALRSRVARLYGLWGPTTKISYIVAGDERQQKVPLKCQADLLSLLEASQSIDSPPLAHAIIVTGDRRLPWLAHVRAVLSVATALALTLTLTLTPTLTPTPTLTLTRWRSAMTRAQPSTPATPG